MEFLRLICRFIFKIFLPTKVYNAEAVPAEGPVIIASNHETMMDMFMIGYRVKRYVKWMAKSELFRFKPFGWFLKKLGAYPVKRNTKDTQAVRTTDELLQKGEVVGIFPQGTRSRGRGRSLPVKAGFVRFAADNDATVVPVAVWGKLHIFGKGRVRFGTPFKVSDFVPEGEELTKEKIREIAEQTVSGIYDMIEAGDENIKG